MKLGQDNAKENSRVRRIMATLEDEGLAENTLVMFTSDNGGPGYIGLPEVNAPYRGWKLQVSKNPNKAWLYNLAVDSTEQNNLADSRSDKLNLLTALLDEHKASGRKPLYPYVSEMAVAVDKTLADYFKEGDKYIYWPN